MSETVIGHVLRRLKALGADAVFGVPGDFAFNVQDAIVAEPGLHWIGCCNELNAGYAADGYARRRGIGVLSTTYGVGELSALNAVAGSYAENVAVVHLTGMPAMPVQHAGSLVHHTLGTGEFDLFRRMADTVTCASAIMTPTNVVAETHRLLTAALYHRRPVYMAFPSDLAAQPVAADVNLLASPIRSRPDTLRAACAAVRNTLGSVDNACLVPGVLLDRLGLARRVTELIDESGLPFATMFADKATLNEQHPNYIGMYYGTLMNDEVRRYVENCDQVALIGTRLTDFNSGAFTARLDPSRTIDIAHHHTRVGDTIYPDVEIGDLLNELELRRSTPRVTRPRPHPPSQRVGIQSNPITADALYAKFEQFFSPEDTIIAETGTAALGLAFARLPSDARYLNQTLWGSIGWATPAALGAAIADPSKRTVLITGEGSHQLTVQEISQFGRRGLKPIIFVINNRGYLIERLLCRDPATAYNDIASWNYTALPSAFGCTDWFTAKVATCGELDSAMRHAATCDTGAYIEILTEPDSAPAAAKRLHDNAANLYGYSGSTHEESITQ